MGDTYEEEVVKSEPVLEEDASIMNNEIEEDEEDKDNIMRKARILFKELKRPINLANIEKIVREEEEQHERELELKRLDEQIRREEQLAEEIAAQKQHEEEEEQQPEKEATKEKKEATTKKKGIVIDEIPEYDEEEKEDEDITFDYDEPKAAAEEHDLFHPGVFEITAVKSIIKDESKETVKETEFNPLQIIDFMIDTSIQKAEGEAKRAFLVSRLDRPRLLTRIIQLQNDIISETNKNQYFNRVAFEHFKRRKHSRALIPDDQQKLQELLLMFRGNLSNLDDIFCKSELLEKEQIESIKPLQNEIKRIEDNVQKDIAKLKKLVIETGEICFNDRTGQFLTEEYVSRQINKVLRTWQEIGNIRIETIYSQHRSRTYAEVVTALDDIGGGLNVTNYEALRAEAEKIATTVEDRVSDIYRSKAQCNKCTQFMAHVKEKTEIIKQTIKEKNFKLTDLKERNKIIREKLIALQKQRNVIRQKYRKLAWEAGLKDKPALLHDYDNTLERIGKVENNIIILEAEKKKLSAEIKKLIIKYNVK